MKICQNVSTVSKLGSYPGNTNVLLERIYGAQRLLFLVNLEHIIHLWPPTLKRLKRNPVRYILEDFKKNNKNQ